ncbi:MAG: hypothetical protein ACQEXX_21525 [Bacillota bacterium]
MTWDILRSVVRCYANESFLQSLLPPNFLSDFLSEEIRGQELMLPEQLSFGKLLPLRFSETASSSPLLRAYTLKAIPATASYSIKRRLGAVFPS